MDTFYFRKTYKCYVYPCFKRIRALGKMATTKKVYTLNEFKQLIDLNGESTNFDVQFSVTSQTNEPFEIIVVDQTTLDGTPTLDYKVADQGTLSGNIVQDKNNHYQNYFLVLKSSKPNKCVVEITKKELPKPIPQSRPAHQQPPVATNSGTPIPWTKIVLIVVVVAILGYVLYRFSQKKDDSVEMGGVEMGGGARDTTTGFKFSPVASDRSVHSSPSPSSPSSSAGSDADNGNNLLLDRLKSLNIH